MPVMSATAEREIDPRWSSGGLAAPIRSSGAPGPVSSGSIVAWFTTQAMMIALLSSWGLPEGYARVQAVTRRQHMRAGGICGG
jgi:hypothetical protein